MKSVTKTESNVQEIAQQEHWLCFVDPATDEIVWADWRDEEAIAKCATHWGASEAFVKDMAQAFEFMAGEIADRIHKDLEDLYERTK
jgi:hypothetical protein